MKLLVLLKNHHRKFEGGHASGMISSKKYLNTSIILSSVPSFL